jgi:trimeric autotransporter adhesin
MSTKTTFKRIALVAVAALGLGVLTSVAPASATAVPAVGASSGYSLNTSSITLVDTTSDTTPGNDIFGAFEVSLSNSNGYANTLQTGESLTATVIGNPGNGVVTANTNIQLSWASTWAPQDGSATNSTYGASDSIGSADSAYAKDLNRSTALRGGTGTATDYSLKVQAGLGAATATYALMVAGNATAAVDAGFYTIRIDLLDVNKNAIKSSTVKFQVVSSKVNSGAVVTTTVTGSQLKGAVVASSLTQSITATLADANGGLVRTGANAAPSLSGTITDSTLVTPIVDALTLTDAGTDTNNDDSILDGSYVATSTSAAVIAGIVGAATVKVVFGAASSSAALVITGTSANFIKTAVTATAKVATVTDGTNFYVPLTTKSASVKATVVNGNLTTSTGVADASVFYTLNYTDCVLGDMAPTQVKAASKLVADANGAVTLDITNANPIDGCKATVVFSGGTNYTGAAGSSLTREITWSKPIPTAAVVSTGSYTALLASTHKLTWTIVDQFGAPVVGSTVTFSHSGANKPAATTSAPSAISDANGQVSYSWTDAKGVVDSTTLGFDTVALAQVGTTPFAKGSVKVTYAATLPAIASLYSTYTTTDGAATPTTLTGTVPTTNIGGVAGILISTADQIDTTKVLTGTSAAPYVKLNFQARKAAAITGTSGVPTVVTVTGAKLIGSDGKLGTTVTVYANDDVYVLGTTTGVATVTATNGTIVSTATINFVNAATDARVLKLTEAAGLVTASVTDAFGNAVKGVDVDVVGTGGAWLGNGATSATFKTATDGTVTFSVTGAGTVTASLSSTYTKASFLAGAGNATGTVVTTGAPAGVRSASVATTGNNVTADSAQAAADAAAEATDAANAATDAANAAAEAADAATAAAQDAADAVAALSTQVSEMVSALKKQITALTNLVIKIQKKVRA